MEDIKRYHIPRFGSWDYFDDLPITQYLESAAQAGLVRGGHCGREEADLFNCSHNHRKEKSGGEKEKQRKQGRVCDVGGQQSPRRRRMKGDKRAPKAVDEDLYKIPPEVVDPKPSKRKRVLRSWWTGCMGIGCIA